MPNLALGVDIGGTNVRAAVVDADTATFVERRKAVWNQKDPDSVALVTSKLVEELRLPPHIPLGVGFAGMLRGNLVVNAPNLGWRDVDFGSLLGKKTGREVHLFNDLSAAAWGELVGGAARGHKDTFTVFVGTGVGSAIVTRGSLLSGSTGVAGEFGHVKLTMENGRPCGCGQRGCLEAYVGGINLAKWMSEEGLQGTASELEKLAASGEPAAVRLYRAVSDALALAIANQVTVLNPSVVVLGGGVLSHCPGLVKRIEQVVKEYASAASAAELRVTLAELGDDAGLLGAALLPQANVRRESSP